MARVPFAMARDGLLPSFFAKVSRRFHVPTYSVLFMGICAMGFAIVGDVRHAYGHGGFFMADF